VVSRKILGEIAGEMGVGPFIILGHSEKKSRGHERLSTLANTFEALLGAIYLDGSLRPSRRFLAKFLFSRVKEFCENEDNFNYKSAILELSQRDGFGIPRYRLINETGPDHAKEFTVQIEIAGVPLGIGCGPNKKIAQQTAAQHAAREYNESTIKEKLSQSIPSKGAVNI
jgi:ribonuclease III